MEYLTESGSDAEIATDNDQTDTQDEDRQGHLHRRQDIGTGIESQVESCTSFCSCALNSRPEIFESTITRTAPSPTNRKIWTSSNAFINYLQDFRNKMKERPGKLAGKQVVKLAGEQWRQMTAEQKQPYRDAAAWVKKQNLTNPKKVKAQKRKRPKNIELKKDITTAKRLGKKKKKSKRGKKKAIKKQKMLKEVSESESGTESESEVDSPVSSDNESVASETSI